MSIRGLVASNEADARNHLSNLLADRSPSGSSPVLASSLNKALTILAEQLYTERTHFLFELVQNADDNSYDEEVIPQLSMRLAKTDGHSYFFMWCNEQGFTFPQLDALLSLGNSTKAGTDGKKTQTGEKGIGFKSVFKVADLVHISSGFYEFKLKAKPEPIGMIQPIPAPFPKHQWDHCTTGTRMLFDLKGDDDRQMISRQLSAWKPETLLFLRRLRKLSLIDQSSTTSYNLHTKHNQCFGGKVACVDETLDVDAKVRKRTYTFMMTSHMVTGLEDSKRPGIKSSEVVVAFPIHDLTQESLPFYSTYAFLPIGTFGFKYLIHADFQLTANREEVLSCAWNDGLRDGIPRAILKAIQQLNSTSAEDRWENLCYKWPAYVERNATSSEFWDNLQQQTEKLLQGEPILIAESGQLAKPSALLWPPLDFFFEDESGSMSPLLDTPQFEERCLAVGYDTKDIQLPAFLRRLGVKEMDVETLLCELKSWVDRDKGAELQGKPSSWHCQFSSIFLKVAWQSACLDTLQQLPIIPLQDGTWVSATSPGIYLPLEDGSNGFVPTGIRVSLVDADAAKDPRRRQFFQSLGIVAYSPRTVCQLILQYHGRACSGSISKENRSAKQWVDDITYLFEHRNTFSVNPASHLCFLLSRDNRIHCAHAPGDHLYQLSKAIKPPLPVAFENYYLDPEGPFRLISREYEHRFSAGKNNVVDEFLKWLSHRCGVLSRPNLFDHHGFPSREWTYLATRDRVMDLLLLLKYQVQACDYKELVRGALALNVPCRGGSYNSLCQTALPLPALIADCPHLNYLDIPVEDSGNWLSLGRFGVTITIDRDVRIQELTALRGLDPATVDADNIHRLYMGLNKSIQITEEWGADSDTFRQISFNLIFIPTPYRQWIDQMAQPSSEGAGLPEDLVWDGPRELTQLIRLKTYYSDCEPLFSQILGIPAAGPRHVIRQLEALVEKGSTDQAKYLELLRLLSRTPYHRFQPGMVMNLPIFPVRASASNTVVMRSVAHGNWYIPDDESLNTAFRGHVDILDASVSETRDLRPLFEPLFVALNREPAYLSRSAREFVRPSDPRVRNHDREKDLGKRLVFIDRLVEKSLRPKLFQFSAPNFCRIWTVPSINRVLKLNNVEIDKAKELLHIPNPHHTMDIFLPTRVPQNMDTLIKMKIAERFAKISGIDDNNAYQQLLLLMVTPYERLDFVLSQDQTLLSQLSEPENDQEPDSSESIVETPADTEAPAGSRGSGPVAMGSARLGSNTRVSSSMAHPSPSKRRRVENSVQYESERIDMGIRGEEVVNEYFKNNIKDWSSTNWTSPSHTHTSNQAGFSDFTYTDRKGYMKRLLQKATSSERRERLDALNRSTTYKIEVKATTNELRHAFWLRQEEVDKMKGGAAEAPATAYLLCRVYNLSSQPGIEFVADPWQDFQDGKLKLVADGYDGYLM